MTRRELHTVLAVVMLSGTSLLAQVPSTTRRIITEPGILQDSAAIAASNRARVLLGLAPRNPSVTRVFFVDTLRSRTCAMPVAVPDSTRGVRMPVDRRDSMNSVAMPAARPSCVNPLFRP